MGRAWTFVAVGLLIILSIWMQRVAVELLGPGSAFYTNIETVTWPVDGDVWADQMYEVIAVWCMWIFRVGVVVVAFYQEFLRQNVTAARAAGRPR